VTVNKPMAGINLVCLPKSSLRKQRAQIVSGTLQFRFTYTSGLVRREVLDRIKQIGAVIDATCEAGSSTLRVEVDLNSVVHNHTGQMSAIAQLVETCVYNYAVELEALQQEQLLRPERMLHIVR